MRRAIVILSQLLCTTAWGQDSLNVTKVGQLTMLCYDVAVEGNYAYIPSDSFRVIDVSDPVAPIIVGACGIPSLGLGVVVEGTHACVAAGGLHVIDISNPTAPIVIGFCDAESSARSVVVSGNYAYVACGVMGFKIVNVSNPASPAVVWSWWAPWDNYVFNVAVSGHNAYLAMMDGIHVYDVSTPSNPEGVGMYDTPDDAHDIAVQGIYAHVANESGLRILDISNPAFPTEVGFDSATGIGIAVAGQHVFLAGGDSGFRVIDVADVSSPVDVGYYNTPGAAVQVAVSGRYAYIADVSYFGIYDCSAALGTSHSFIPHPSSFILSAYPNPFNATTQIRFDVPRSSLVQVRIYDLQGRLVDELASRMFDAGTHTLNYDASAHASGMYVVRMTSGDFSAAQKVLLLK